jgi:manganese/zinc/iron transport system substrate-binding protein
MHLKKNTQFTCFRKKPIEKLLFTCFLILSPLFFLLSCSDNESSLNDPVDEWILEEKKLRVLSTIEMIDDLVKQIGKQHVATLPLIRNSLDPHTYELVKGDGEKFEYADLIFYNGLGLEHGPSLKHALESKSNAVPLGNAIKEQFPEKIFYLGSMPDPHIWMDIELWMYTVPVIVDSLSAHDPVHADEYHANGETLFKIMEEENLHVRKLMHSIPEERRYLVTSHDAFNYFARSYLALEPELASDEWQKRCEAPEGLSPETQISTTDIQNIIDHLKKYKIHVLFAESNVSKDSVKKIVDAMEEKGERVKIASTPLYSDAMGAAGSAGDSYLGMIRHNAETISRFLKESIDDTTESY